MESLDITGLLDITGFVTLTLGNVYKSPFAYTYVFVLLLLIRNAIQCISNIRLLLELHLVCVLGESHNA